MNARLASSPPLPPAVWMTRRQPTLPYPLDEPDARIFAWGRCALWHGVRAAGLGSGDAVLVPSWHHGSEIEALVRAGLTCRAYEGDPVTAEPRADELEALLDGSVRALLLIHHLGWPRDAARWRRWCDERGLLLIEDCAQAWLSEHDGRPLGSLGDVAIWCLYKAIALPEGAVLRCAAPPPQPALDPRFGSGVLARSHLAWLASRSGAVTSAAARLRPARPYSHADDIGLRDPAAGVWRSQPGLLERLAAPGVAARRHANAARLIGALGDVVPEPFATLPIGTAPYGVPIEVDDRAAVLAGLRRAGVHAMAFWMLPHPLLADEPRSVRRRRERTLLLPCHQGLRPRDLDRIVAATREAIAAA